MRRYPGFERCLIGARLIAACLLFATASAADAPPSQTFTPIDPYDQVAAMGRGMNVLGYDPVWDDPSQARFQPRHFQKIRDAGFSTVRIGVHAFEHMDADNKLDPVWLGTLDSEIAAALDAGLSVSLDLHYQRFCGTDLPSCERQIEDFWSQVAPRYQGKPNRLMFELLNEPHGMLDAKAWNEILRAALAIVRESNPTRNVIIGPAGWSSVDQLKTLDLPDDPHIIVTVHYYWPMKFTHQGARWVKETAELSGIAWGSAEDEAKVRADFDAVKAWSDAHHRPIFLGEFGAYDRGGSDVESRFRYNSAVARAAEAHGFAWAYWQFDSDFVAYDMATDEWVPAVLYALIPPVDAASKGAKRGR